MRPCAQLVANRIALKATFMEALKRVTQKKRRAENIAQCENARFTGARSELIPSLKN